MFDTNFNIIHGDRISGRTQFLFKISNAFKEVDFKLFFLGCTDIDTKDRFNDVFEDYRVINTFDEINNFKIIEVIKELSEKRNYNFIIIDDIDYLSKSCIDLLSSIDTKKIVTCLSDNCKKLPKDSNFYNISDVSDLSNIDEIVKKIIRDQKINSVLK
jgi:thymidine kinase